MDWTTVLDMAFGIRVESLGPVEEWHQADDQVTQAIERLPPGSIVTACVDADD